MTGVRYFYRHETNGAHERWVTVAYTHERETGQTNYGASIFRRDRVSETFVKASHRQTALARLQVRPVTLVVVAETLFEVEEAIRHSMFTAGKGERRVDTAVEARQ